MTNTFTFHETHQPAEAVSAGLFNGLVATGNGNDFEAWIATLTRLADEQEVRARVQHDPGSGNSSREIRNPLQKVAAGPYTSLGGYFDYSLWPDRERFLELDKAIAAGQEIREDEVDHDVSMF